MHSYKFSTQKCIVITCFVNVLLHPLNILLKEKEYDIDYYLDDGIYPKWPTIVQTIQRLKGQKK